MDKRKGQMPKGRLLLVFSRVPAQYVSVLLCCGLCSRVASAVQCECEYCTCCVCQENNN
jgi:hypothetical protein